MAEEQENRLPDWVGRCIRQRRKSLRLTQEELAESCGYSPNYIGSVENSRKTPSMEFLFNVAAALETSPSELLVEGSFRIRRDQIKNEIKDLLELL